MNNLNMNNKTPIKDITKDILNDLYFNKKMSINDIGKHFGYFDRQPISRLFKKFNIVCKSKSQANKDLQNSKYIFPTVEELKELLKTNSVLKLSKLLNIPRGTLNKYMSNNDIQNDYFKNKNLKDELKNFKYDDMSPKEISLLLNVDISVIKYYKKDFKKIIYSVDEIKAKFEKYNYDTENQGLIKQIKNDDSNLFESILKLTENHVLESEKFTERLYRLFNNYSHETVEKCKFCENNLKFYTFKLGYGNSKHNICKLCNQATNGVSLISQDLFWKIYNELCENKKSETKFSHLNNEKKLIITEADKLNLTHVKEKLNKNLYYLDFICKNKVIEFDGTYYHTDKEKDFAKDEFLKLKGYQVLRIPELEYYKDKNKILKQCINFLNQ